MRNRVFPFDVSMPCRFFSYFKLRKAEIGIKMKVKINPTVYRNRIFRFSRLCVPKTNRFGSVFLSFSKLYQRSLSQTHTKNRRQIGIYQVHSLSLKSSGEVLSRRYSSPETSSRSGGRKKQTSSKESLRKVLKILSDKVKS